MRWSTVKSSNIYDNYAEDAWHYLRVAFLKHRDVILSARRKWVVSRVVHSDVFDAVAFYLFSSTHTEVIAQQLLNRNTGGDMGHGVGRGKRG